MQSVLMHPTTKASLETYFDKPVSVLALTGPVGSGKKYLSQIIATKLVGTSYDKGVNNGQILNIVAADDKQEISIETVRALISKLSLKTSSAKDRRVVIINELQSLSTEGQNALLKNLEQPSSTTHFILTMPQSSSVLPTIISRVTLLPVKSIDLPQALKYFSDHKDASDIKSAWSLSKGLAGQMYELLISEDSQLGESVKVAKKFLSLNKYERLLLLDNYSKSNDKLTSFLYGLGRVLEAAHHNSIEKSDLVLARRLSESRRVTYRLNEQLSLNTSVKLTVMQLVNSLKV